MDFRTHLDIDVEHDLLLVRPDEKFDGWRVEIDSKVVGLGLTSILRRIDLGFCHILAS